MKLIRGIHNWPAAAGRQAVTIGNFDGVHLGHQRILKLLQQQAQARALASLLIIMEPQPQEFFSEQQAKPRLTRLREKLLCLQHCPIDRVLCLSFNQDLSNLSGQDFIRSLLVKQLQAAYILVGDDFHFGQNRQGDIALLKDYGPRYQFEVGHIDTIEIAGQRVSSTRIRDALAAGQLSEAQQLLGRAYSMCGRVASGDQRGRQWGIPTANVYLHRRVSPIRGVYVVKVKGLGNTAIHGVANVGNRPTVDGSRSLLEVHLFDFDQNIYGRYIDVEFIHKLRDEKRFNGIELLKQQIFQDVADAKAFFKREQ